MSDDLTSPTMVHLMRYMSELVDGYGLAAIRSVLDVIEAEQARKTPPVVRWSNFTPDPDDVRALEAWVEERLRDGDL